MKLPKQRYQLVKLKSLLWKLVNRYEKSVTNDNGYLMFVVIVNHKKIYQWIRKQPDINSTYQVPKGGFIHWIILLKVDIKKWFCILKHQFKYGIHLHRRFKSTVNFKKRKVCCLQCHICGSVLYIWLFSSLSKILYQNSKCLSLILFYGIYLS
jgi:hypothetical protein